MAPVRVAGALILSAQATDKSVNLATRELFRSPTRRRHCSISAKIACASTCSASPVSDEEQTHHPDVPHAAGTTQRQVPQTREALEALPGWAKTQRDYEHRLGQPTIAVDTHIFRVSNRIGLAPARLCWRWRTSY